jgi:hypothetical protein
VDNNTTEVETTRIGAAFPAARSAWISTTGVAASHALAQNSVLAANRPDPRCAALRQIPAPAMPIPAPTMPFGTRKQTTNVHKTRISAGGYGAMGPYPERESRPN